MKYSSQLACTVGLCEKSGRRGKLIHLSQRNQMKYKYLSSSLVQDIFVVDVADGNGDGVLDVHVDDKKHDGFAHGHGIILQ